MHIMMPDLCVQPEHTEEFIEAIVNEVEHALEVEPGIIAFDLTQNHKYPNVIHVHAVYVDEAALQFHMKQLHFLELIEKLNRWRIDLPPGPIPRSGRVLHPRPGHWEKLAAEKAKRFGASAPKKGKPSSKKPVSSAKRSRVVTQTVGKRVKTRRSVTRRK